MPKTSETISLKDFAEAMSRYEHDTASGIQWSAQQQFLSKVPFDHLLELASLGVLACRTVCKCVEANS